jgi:SET domain-containing protein
MFRKAREEYPRFFVSDKVIIDESPIHGIGIFAAARIEPRELIEACPIILFHNDVFEILNDFLDERITLLDYPFAWKGVISAFSLGYGGIYNHDTNSPNATWKCNYENESLDFYSRCVIEPGQEICTRYMPKSRCDDLWFNDPTATPFPLTGD